MVMLFRLGQRITPTCAAGYHYFPTIDECLPLSLVAMPLFLSAITRIKVCNGSVVRTIGDLEGLRYCNQVNGSLLIYLNDSSADFKALYDIPSISGERFAIYV